MDRDEIDLVDGSVRPTRVRTTPCDSILFMCDSNQRISGSPFNFTVTSYRPVYGQSAYISRIAIPKIPNINANNNVLTFVSTVGTFSGTIPIGYYNQVSLVNALKLCMDTAAGGLDTYTVTYNTNNKTISVTSVGGNNFFFSSSCSFIQYGINVCNFSSNPLTSNPAIVGALVQNSAILGLIYTRYITIRSARLCANPVDVPRSSSGRVNVVAMVSVAQHFNPQDFDPSGVFTGSILTDETFKDSAVLKIANQKKDLSSIDFLFEDEFGFVLDTSLDLGVGYQVNQLGCLLWLTITL